MLKHRRAPNQHHLGEEATMAAEEVIYFSFQAQPSLRLDSWALPLPQPVAEPPP